MLTKTEESLAKGFNELAQTTGVLTKGISYLVGAAPETKSIGDRILETGRLDEVVGGTGSIRLDLNPSEIKSAILSTGTINDRLVPSGTHGLDPGARRTLFIRDLLPSFPTENGAIEMPVLSSKTNNAGPQVGNSPQQRENVNFGESAYDSSSNSYVPVETIGHSVYVSKQVFEDSGQLNGFINTEMLYGLEEKIEDQILNGVGTTGQLDGLLQNATAFVNESPNITHEIDVIRSAIKQVRLANFAPNAILLNENDWFDIEIRKFGSADAYVSGYPRIGGEPSLWGLPVYVSNAIASGTFLVADFNRCGIVFDRQQPMIEISRHTGSNFTKGMLTFLASARLALVNTNPLAMVTGSL